ncbi:MAG: hypothetical protein ABUL62_30005 [Myxococcales bacterium]|jgi:hypothetical protein
MDELIRFIAVAVSMAAAGLSYYCFRLTQRRSMQPLLAFSTDGQNENGHSPWYVENVGNGPAINISLAAGKTPSELDARILRLPALARGARHSLDWVGKTEAYVAEYRDVHGRLYQTTAYQNDNQISEPSRAALVPTLFLWQLEQKQLSR